jgi:hypothetical protein
MVLSSANQSLFEGGLGLVLTVGQLLSVSHDWLTES